MSDIVARLNNTWREADPEMNHLDRRDAAEEIERLRIAFDDIDVAALRDAAEAVQTATAGGHRLEWWVSEYLEGLARRLAMAPRASSSA